MTHPSKSLVATSFLLCFASFALACDAEPGPAESAELEPRAPAFAGPEPTPVSAGDCCETDSAPGCSDSGVEACVCAADPYCCTTAWDSLCASEVESLGCGTCGSDYCCAAETSPGCELPSVEACVCGVDPYCCTTAWDGLCASEVESLGCGSCALGWAFDIGSEQAETVEPSSAVAVDSAGNVYVLGTFYSAKIDLGAGSQVRQGYSDVFLVSYAADGSYRWSRVISSDDWDFARGIAVDGSGNVYVTGGTEGVLDLGGGILPPAGSVRDMFIASYTSTGAHRWSQRHGGSGAALAARDLAANAAGDLVLTGVFDGSLSLGGSTLSDAGDSDMFVLALDDSGAHRWSRALGGAVFDSAADAAVDPAGGAVVVGSFGGTVDFGLGPVTSAGAGDGVVVRLESDGSTDWVRRYGSTGSDGAAAVVLDAEANSYVLGGFSGTIDLGDGPRVAAGTSEALLVSYDDGGSLRWSRRIGGSGLDYGRGITLATDGHVVATGGFFGTSGDFGGPPLTGAGGYDVFLASYEPDTGAHDWSTRFGTSAREDGYDLAAAPSGALVLVGDFASTLPIAGTTLVSGGGFSDVFVTSLMP